MINRLKLSTIIFDIYFNSCLLWYNNKNKGGFMKQKQSLKQNTF